MPQLRALPHANFRVGPRHYTSDATGLLRDVHGEDVAALLNAGAVALEPFTVPPSVPKEPEPRSSPPPPEPPTVKLLTPAPHQHYATREGRHYRSGADRAVLVRADDAPQLLRAGCSVA